MIANANEFSGLKFPHLLDSVEKVSKEAQFRFFLLKGVELGGLAAAAFVAATPEDWWGGAAPIIALCLFVVVGVLQVTGRSKQEEARWYEARAAAESIKSLSWQFAVKGSHFPDHDDAAPTEFVRRLQEILGKLKRLNQAAATSNEAAITDSMASLRSSGRDVRTEVYRRLRVEDQLKWYGDKTRRNRRTGAGFLVVVVGVELAAVVVGGFQIKAHLTVDFLSIFAAVAASVVGWTQAKKFDYLAESYAVTSQEIALLVSDLGSEGDEAAWADRVRDAETAFSREHTMWLARTRDR